MKAIILIIAIFAGSTQSNAESTCGNTEVLKDPAVLYGEDALKLKLIDSEHYGDAEGRVKPTAQLVKSKSQEVINLFECLIGNKKITLTFNVETFKKKIDELEKLERQTIPHGGKLIPTQEDIQIVDGAIEAMKFNRLALAYIRGFKIQ